MENKLEKLFDYQKFEGNKELNELIKETEARVESDVYKRELNDEELLDVNAAGIRAKSKPIKKLDELLDRRK